MLTTVSRLTAAVTFGGALTTVLLLLMQSLIESDHSATDEPPSAGTLAFLPAVKETPPVPEERRPEEPPKPVQPPLPPDLVRHDPAGPGTAVEITAPKLEGPSGPMAGTLSDGDALPVVKVRPVYPARALRENIEGHVLVEFTIDELGRVVDVRVIESKPRGTFDRAALEAVERFRYKPRVVNGEATPVSGVRHLVSFELSS